MILIIVGVILLIAEVIIPGFFVGVVATAFLFVGIISLIFEEVLSNPAILIGVAIVGLAIGMTISILFYKKLGKEQKPITSTGESLVGRTGIITVPTEPHHPTKGKVRLGSEIWSAEADKIITEGAKVEVVDSIGAHVKVVEMK